MPYIGNTPAEKYVSLAAQHFTVSATTSYTLTHSVTNEVDIALFINNVRQQPGSSYAYTASGTTLTLSAATAGTDTMYCVYLGKAIGTITPPDNSVDSAKIVNGSVTNADLATGIDASKLTTGTLPIARIADDAINSEHYAAGSIDLEHMSSQSVDEDNLHISNAGTNGQFLSKNNGNAGGLTWATVTEYDDASLRADILNLALNQAIADNRVAFNLDNSFVDGFEDDTGITTETNVDRDTGGEYVKTAVTNSTDFAVTFSGGGGGAPNTGLRFPGAAGTVYTGDITVEWWQKTTSGQSSTNGVFGSTNEVAWTADAWHVGYYNSSIVYGRATSGVSASFGFSSSGHDGSWHHLAFVRQSGTMRAYLDGVASSTTHSDSTTLGNANYKLIVGAQEPGGTQNFVGTLDGLAITSGTVRYPDGTTFTPPTAKVTGNTFTHHFDASTPGHNTSTPDYRSGNGPATIIGNVSAYGSVGGRFQALNATGTLISDAQTASSSRTSCTGVIMYENESGTATLGTDLKIYFTANNGTNWTEAASYGTATTYSGGKKLVKLAATTVTGGTQIALKAVWANQVLGSKVTRLHGWAVNY